MTSRHFRYLSANEVAFIDAAADRIIPTDDLGAGAGKSGAAEFIDGQLCSGWGHHSRQYRMGPWMEGTSQQGYQSPLTPQALYRQSIVEVNELCTSRYGKFFHFLSDEELDHVLRELDTGAIVLPTVPARTF